MRKKNINLFEAREISKKFCEDLKIPYCEIYYVDKLDDCHTLGLYFWVEPSHILLLEKAKNMITLLMHELTHHLDSCNYSTVILDHSSRGYILAKKRVITWCKKNISDKPDWNKALKCKYYNDEMKKFRL